MFFFIIFTEINGYRLPSHTPFFSVLKIINHKIVSEEEPPGKYIPIYFQDRDKVVPLWLHPKAIDFNTNLLKERIKMILHIVLHISDLDKICFDSSSIEALNDLGNCAVRILYDGHEECYREHCLKVGLYFSPKCTVGPHQPVHLKKSKSYAR